MHSKKHLKKDLGELGITNLDGDGGSDDLKLDFEEIM